VILRFVAGVVRAKADVAQSQGAGIDLGIFGPIVTGQFVR